MTGRRQNLIIPLIVCMMVAFAWVTAEREPRSRRTGRSSSKTTSTATTSRIYILRRCTCTITRSRSPVSSARTTCSTNRLRRVTSKVWRNNLRCRSSITARRKNSEHMSQCFFRTSVLRRTKALGQPSMSFPSRPIKRSSRRERGSCHFPTGTSSSRA